MNLLLVTLTFICALEYPTVLGFRHPLNLHNLNPGENTIFFQSRLNSLAIENDREISELNTAESASTSIPNGPVYTREVYHKMTVLQLKEILRSRKLFVSGVKAELINRLTDDDNIRESTVRVEITTDSVPNDDSINLSPSESDEMHTGADDDDDFLAQLMDEGEKLLSESAELMDSGGCIDSDGENRIVSDLEKEIQLLVDERSKTRALKDYISADAIKEELLQRFNVVILDKAGQWICRSKGLSGPLNAKKFDMELRYHNEATAPISTERIQYLIDMRSVAMKRRDDETNKKIKLELRNHNVSIYDREGEWVAGDGRKGPITGHIRKKKTRDGRTEESSSSASLEASSSLSETDSIEKVLSLYDAEQTFKHGVDAQQRDSSDDDDNYEDDAIFDDEQMNGDTLSDGDDTSRLELTPCTLTPEQVQALVDDRTAARRSWNYVLADRIRDELAMAGIELFDRINEWRAFDKTIWGLQSQDRNALDLEEKRASDRGLRDRGGARGGGGGFRGGGPRGGGSRGGGGRRY